MGVASNRAAAMLLWMVRWLYSKFLAVACTKAPKTTPTLKSSLLTDSATALAARIRQRKVTSLEVVQSYINRIQEVNDVLNCVVDDRFEEALAEAREADEAVSGRTPEELQRERPLLGVPFTIPLVPGLHASRGVHSATALMTAAGAIPIACTNVSEGPLLWETTHPVFGRTCNPYDTNRSVGGPFGGEACVVAACGSPVGVAPSPTTPSAFCGVFGHKPSEDVSGGVGPISRSSADLLPLLRILTKNSPADLRLNDPVDLTKLRYFFMDDSGSRFTSPVSSDIKDAIHKAVRHFSGLKAPVQRVRLRQMRKAYLIWKLKAPRGHLSLLHLFKELLKALFRKSNHTFLFLFASLTDHHPQHSQQLAQDSTALLKTFQDLLRSDGVFIYPTHPTAALRHNDSVPNAIDFGYSAIFDALGLPATHCPAGIDSHGLPIGFQVVAALHHDRLTLAVAREIHRALAAWTPPPSHGTFTLKTALLRPSSPPNTSPPSPPPQRPHDL